VNGTATVTTTLTTTDTIAAADATSSHSERERVLSDFRAHAKAHMSDPAALRAWAWAAFRAGEIREARRAANAWSLHDGTSEPRIFLSMTLESSGRRSEAKAVLDEWLQVHPDAVDAKRALARLTGEHTTTKSELARNSNIAR
jgi:hypothetical protein